MAEQVTVSGRKIEVKQLTMRQIRNVLAELKKKGEPHVIDTVFDDDVPAIALAEATGLRMDGEEGPDVVSLLDLSQEEVKELLDTFKAVNPFFFGMMERIISMATQNAPSSAPSVS